MKNKKDKNKRNDKQIIMLHSKNTNQNNSRLALDIGTNSIGWALYGLDKNKKPCNIISAGVRVFASGRNEKGDSTLNATRRMARLQRRQRDRYLQRLKYLLSLLEKYGLFPKDKSSAKKLSSLNPYELRAKGLDQKLPIHHFGRALFHLSQRRGFKSNRRSADPKEDGLIAQSIKSTKQAMGNLRTYGEFLWNRFQKMETSRKTPGSQKDHWILARKSIGVTSKDQYAVYAQRSMIEDEFNKLWDVQVGFHPKLKNQKIKKEFRKAIFDQRPLKKPVVGICEFTGEQRIYKALSSFQKFRILKEFNNLAYVTERGEVYSVVKMDKGIEFRDKVIKNLFQKKAKITFSALEKQFKQFFSGINNFSHFNLDSYNRDFLEGDQTSVVLSKIIPDWNQYSLDVQDRFVELLEGEGDEENNEQNPFMKTDEEVLDNLKNFNKQKQLKLSEDQLNQCIKKLNNLPKDHGQLSKKAISQILPLLEKGVLEYDAMTQIFGSHSDKRYKGELKRYLPHYQNVLKSHCVEMRRASNKSSKTDDQDVNKYFRIPNPTVHIAFNQLRLVVNDIIRFYGKPLQAVIETARELPLGAVSKRKRIKQQKQNKERNEEAKKIIDEFGQKNNKTNRVRYFLWQEQKQKCIYSGKSIPKSKLYHSELEIDHILPYSKTLDDGLSNKVLVYKTFNQNKGNSIPFEVFSSNKKQWDGVLHRVRGLPQNKQWRFNKNAMERFTKDGDFLSRQLNDTRYISRYAKQYLERVFESVWTVRGQTTAILRHLLQYDKKDRSDHRHHAKDALAIGLVDRSLVQKVSNIAKSIEGSNKNRLENIAHCIKKDIVPWENFKDDAKNIIDNIIVSHRRRTKKEGQLHNETAYGFLKGVKDFSKAIDVFHHVDILSVTDKKLKKIVSYKIRKDFSDEFKKSGSLSKEFLISYHQKTGVRRVCLKEKQTVIPIKNKSQKFYKAFKGDSNYCAKLFVAKNGKWDADIVSTFSANQKDFQPIPVDKRLMANDMLFFENKFWRLVTLDKNKIFIFVEHCASGNPGILRKDRETKELVSQKVPGSLQQVNPMRVHISPCGKVRLTSFNLQSSETLLRKRV